MKIKRLMLVMLSAVSSMGLAACGGTTSSTPTSTPTQTSTPIVSTSSKEEQPSSTVAEKTLVYQFAGQDTDFASYGFAYSFYLNLYSDGNIDGYGYEIYSLNTESAETNKNLHLWYTGKWAKAKDDNDDDCIKAIVNYAEGVTGMTGEPLNGKFTYNISFASDGKTPLSISQFKTPLGISGKSVDLAYNPNPYKDNDEFIANTVYKFVEPTKYEALFEDTKTKERIYLYEDNTGENFGARSNKDGSLIGYYPTTKSIKWSYTNNELVITIANTAHVVTVEGNKGTMAWEEALYGDYKSVYNFVCNDVSKLIGKESGQEEGKEEWAAYTMYFSYQSTTSAQIPAVTFYLESADWGAKLGGTGNYELVPEDTTALLNWKVKGNSTATFVCTKDGNFSFDVTLGGYNIHEVGTWTFKNFSFKYVDNKNVEHSATLVPQSA